MGLFSFVGDAPGGLFGGSPEAPDYSGIASANEKSAQLAKEAADVTQQFQSQRATAQRQLTSMGGWHCLSRAGEDCTGPRDAGTLEREQP